MLKNVLSSSLVALSISFGSAASAQTSTLVEVPGRSALAESIRLAAIAAVEQTSFSNCNYREGKIWFGEERRGIILLNALSMGKMYRSEDQTVPSVIYIDEAAERAREGFNFQELEIISDQTQRRVQRLRYSIKQMRRVNLGTLTNPRLVFEPVITDTFVCEAIP